MTYNFVFEPEYYRIIPSVIIDARASIPAIKNQIGSVIKEYVDTQLSFVNQNAIVYKIENTANGVLAGYFVIQVTPENKTAILDSKVLRPAYQQFNNELDAEISNFINYTKEWQQDYLF